MTPRSRSRGNPRRRGVALFTALWLVVAIAIVGLQFSLEARARRLAAANAVEIAQSRAAALAGVEHAQARLERLARQLTPTGTGAASLRAADPWLDADTLVRIVDSVGAAPYEVRVRVAGSALDPNRASEEQLRMLFTRLEFDFGLADQLAQCIMDWRDPDVMHRNRGAERDQYVAENRMMLPRDAPFQDIPELLHVMHMTPEIYDSIAPFFAIESTAAINVNTAPMVVVATIPGMTDVMLAGVMRTRDAGRRIANIAELRALGGTSTPTTGPVALNTRFIGYLAQSVTVTSTGWNQGGRSPYRIEAVITRGGNSSAPTTVISRKSR
jgi:general secretion pathway protein K